MKIRIILLSIFYIIPISVFSSEFKIIITKINSDTVTVTWKLDKNIDISQVNIYLYEGFHTGFPSEKVDVLNNKTKVWYFVKGERENILGFEVRKTDQLFDDKFWTQSEVYTIGVEIEYIDFESQKKAYFRDYNYLFPFQIMGNKTNTENIEHFIYEKLPITFSIFLKNDSFGIPINEKIKFDHNKIINIIEKENYFEIYLSSNKLVIYDKSPLRPDFLGNRYFIFYALSVFVILIFVILAFLLYFHISAMNLKNSMDDELFETDKKQIFLDFVQKNRLSTYVVFYLVKYFENKKNADENWHNKLKLVFKKYKLFQTNEIKRNIAEIITTNKIFKGMNSKKIFISYNHKDQVVAKKVKDRLEENEFEVIIDIEAMKTGESIETFIKNCIKHSAITLSLVSENSLVSAWVAMETNFSFYDETLRGKYFLPCNIDNSFFKRSFVDNALDKIKIEFDEIKSLIAKRLENSRGIEDLQLELTRFNKLYNELPTILAKLKNSLCVDLSEENFDNGMTKIIKDINNYFETNEK